MAFGHEGLKCRYCGATFEERFKFLGHVFDCARKMQRLAAANKDKKDPLTTWQLSPTDITLLQGMKIDPYL